MSHESGQVSVYVMYCPGFHHKLRPSHDSAPDAIGVLTPAEVRTLKGKIARYIHECHSRHPAPQPTEANP